MAKTRKTKLTMFEDRSAVYGNITSTNAELDYVKSTPRAKKATQLRIRVNGDVVILGGPQVRQLKKLLSAVG